MVESVFWIGLVLVGVGFIACARNIDAGLASLLPGVVLLVVFVVCASVQMALSRDADGRYAQSPLKPWFDGLRSGKGPCCSDADGTAITDADWVSQNGHYSVRVDGEWLDVPDDAVIKEPNRDGRTIVWPLRGYGPVTIRCFMVGAMI